MKETMAEGVATPISTVTPVASAQTYRVRNKDGECMDITINEASGLFMATGDYGTFSHYWTAPGPHGLRNFLGGIQYDYAMGKLHASGGEVFDFDKSIAAIKAAIREDTGTDLSEDVEAEFTWLDSCDSEERFCQQVAESEEIFKALGSDHYSIRCETIPHGHCVTFWNEFYIPFVASYMPDHRCKPVAIATPEPSK